MTRAEWELLAEGIAALPSDVRAEVDQKIARLTTTRPIQCPLLDEAEGACRVYAHRPSACRTYGYYVERGIGLHCDQITRAVEGHDDVVWGNQESVDAALSRGSGEPSSKSLVEWAAEPSSPSSEM